MFNQAKIRQVLESKVYSHTHAGLYNTLFAGIDDLRYM
jgi:hypothetical protein